MEGRFQRRRARRAGSLSRPCPSWSEVSEGRATKRESRSSTGLEVGDAGEGFGGEGPGGLDQGRKQWANKRGCKTVSRQKRKGKTELKDRVRSRRRRKRTDECEEREREGGREKLIALRPVLDGVCGTEGPGCVVGEKREEDVGFGVVQRRSAQQLHAISTGGALSAPGQEWAPCGVHGGGIGQKTREFWVQVQVPYPPSGHMQVTASVQRSTTGPMTLLRNSHPLSPPSPRRTWPAEARRAGSSELLINHLPQRALFTLGPAFCHHCYMQCSICLMTGNGRSTMPCHATNPTKPVGEAVLGEAIW